MKSINEIYNEAIHGTQPAQQVNTAAERSGAIKESVEDGKDKQSLIDAVEHVQWLNKPFTQTFLIEIEKEIERLQIKIFNGSQKNFPEVELRDLVTTITTYKKVIAYARSSTPLNGAAE